MSHRVQVEGRLYCLKGGKKQWTEFIGLTASETDANAWHPSRRRLYVADVLEKLHRN